MKEFPDTSLFPELKACLTQHMPFLPYFAWHVAEVNPWMHHLFGANIVYLWVERDCLRPVAELLYANDFDVALDPAPGDEPPLWHPKRQHVILRVGRPKPCIEFVLAQLAYEAIFFNLTSPVEAGMVAGACPHDSKRLRRYLQYFQIPAV